jgi:predicted nucleic acid-binding protein
VILVDTGPLYAAADRHDAHHAACAELFRNPPDQLALPLTVIVEASFLIERHLGPHAEAAFLESLPSATITVEIPTRADLARMAELIRDYADLPLGAVDASIIAIAERLDISALFTLDRRHFTVVRPRHTSAFTILP